MAGPACETWSQARENHLAVVMTTTRVLRTAARPWGLEAMSLKEIKQVIFGDTLLGFVNALLVCGGTGLVEHPSCPRKESSASIWRTVLLQVFQALDDFEILDVAQGWYIGRPVANLRRYWHFDYRH